MHGVIRMFNKNTERLYYHHEKSDDKHVNNTSDSCGSWSPYEDEKTAQET